MVGSTEKWEMDGVAWSGSTENGRKLCQNLAPEMPNLPSQFFQPGYQSTHHNHISASMWRQACSKNFQELAGNGRLLVAEVPEEVDLGEAQEVTLEGLRRRWRRSPQS